MKKTRKIIQVFSILILLIAVFTLICSSFKKIDLFKKEQLQQEQEIEQLPGESGTNKPNDDLLDEEPSEENKGDDDIIDIIPENPTFIRDENETEPDFIV